MLNTNLSIERNNYFVIILFFLGEVIIYAIGFIVHEPTMYSKHIFFVQQKKLVTMSLIMDISTLVQITIRRLKVSIVNMFMSTLLVYLILRLNPICLGNSAVYHCVYSYACYNVILGVFCVIMYAAYPVKYDLRGWIIAIETIFLVEENLRIWIKRSGQMAYVFKNIEGIEKLSETLQYMTIKQNRKTRKKVVRKKKHKYYYANAEAMTNRRLAYIAHLKEITHEVFPQCYYLQMAEYLLDNNIQVETIHDLIAIQNGTHYNTTEIKVTPIHQYYRSTDVPKYIKKLGLTPEALIQAATYLDQNAYQASDEKCQFIVKVLNFTNIISVPEKDLNKAELQPFYQCMKEQIAQKIISCLRIACFLQPVQYSYLYLMYSLRKQVINSDAKKLDTQSYSAGCLKVQDTWTHCDCISLTFSFTSEDNNRIINEDVSQDGQRSTKKFLATEGKEKYYAQLKLFDEYSINRVTMGFNFVHQIQSATTPDI